MTKISVVGLGKLGEPFAIALASRGFDVLGVDINQAKVDSLNAGRVTVQEPGAQRLLTACQERFEATVDHRRAVDETDVTFFLVPTPSQGDGKFSAAVLRKAVLTIAAHCEYKENDSHLFIIGSTVMPGTCGDLFQEIINVSYNYSGGIGLCYCPELVALGTVVKGFLHPEFIVIGENDTRMGLWAESIYKKMCPHRPVLKMSLTEAEIFKVALNFYLTLKISFANTLARICEQYHGVDVDNITHAIGHDTRISPKFMKAGPSFGGFCFPRDIRAFGQLGNVTPELARIVGDINERANWHLAASIPTDAKSVAILGLSFKPGTAEVEESPGMYLARVMIANNIRTCAYDPLAMDNAREAIGDFDCCRVLAYANSAKECVAISDAVVITMPHNEYAALEEGDFKPGAVVIDCWRLLKHKLADSERIQYKGIGIG